MINYMDFVTPLSVIIFFFVARDISGIKISWKNFIVWIAGTYILVGALLLINDIAASIALLISIAAIVNTKIKDIIVSITVSLFTMITMIIVKTVSQELVRIVFYKDIDYYRMLPENFKLFATTLVVTFILAAIITRFLHSAINNRFKAEYPKALNRKVVLVFFVSVAIVFGFVYVSALLNSRLAYPILLIIYIGFFLFIVIYTYFMFATSVREEKLVRSKNELGQLAEYTSNIESMYNDIRSMRHDYSNVISSMAGYITDNDMDGLKEYFTKEIVPFSDRMETDDNNLGVLAKLKEPSLKGIFAVKLIKAQESGMEVVVDIQEDINIKSIDKLELNRAAGILLDNAYEAAMECENPYIHVGFIKDTRTISILIVNSVKDEKISLTRIFEQGYSTKGLSRGFGLNNVVSILDNYQNVFLDTVIDDSEFRQVIHIEEEKENNA